MCLVASPGEVLAVAPRAPLLSVSDREALSDWTPRTRPAVRAPSDGAPERDTGFHLGKPHPERALGAILATGMLVAGDPGIIAAMAGSVPRQTRHSPPVQAFTRLVDLLPAAVAGATLLGHGDLHDTGKLAGAGLILSYGAVKSIKALTGRDRPDGQGHVGGFHGPRWADGAFPSGHTAMMFSTATVVGKQYRKWKWWAYGLAAGTAISRVLLDEHHPSDALAGAILGVGIGNFVMRNKGWIARISIKF